MCPPMNDQLRTERRPYTITSHHTHTQRVSVHPTVLLSMRTNSSDSVLDIWALVLVHWYELLISSLFKRWNVYYGKKSKNQTFLCTFQMNNSILECILEHLNHENGLVFTLRNTADGETHALTINYWDHMLKMREEGVCVCWATVSFSLL